LLNDHQELIPGLVKLPDIAIHDNQTPVWTRKRLESSLKFAIHKISRPICLFIDGLDEFDEDETDLILLIDALKSRPSVKICLSSRPLQAFRNAFKDSPQLKLQDLTRQDINIYVEDRLHDAPRMKQLLQDNSQRGKRLIGDVIDKAEGVFLWVTLAVKILLRGLGNKDDWDTMEKRLDLLPKGIENLYTHMWNRLGEDQKIYHEEAALYFRLILEEEMSLLPFVIATKKSLQSKLLDFKVALPETDVIISMCKDAEIHVLTRCGGLLEVDHPDENMSTEDLSDGDISDEDISDEDTPDESISDDYKILASFDSPTKVRFLHRTARDFLVNTKEGQAILGHRPPPASSISVILLKSGLGFCRLLSKARSVVWENVLESIREVQISENDPLESLIDIVESYSSSTYSGGSNWVEKYKMWYQIETPATNFQGLAAAYGLYLDMSKRFVQLLKRTDPSLTNYLLTCTVFGLRFDLSFDPRTELVLMLLSMVLILAQRSDSAFGDSATRRYKGVCTVPFQPAALPVPLVPCTIDTYHWYR
ncbi:MAG: hypothetical protein Q9164_007443, partial [Protoblastenia rupestris]